MVDLSRRDTYNQGVCCPEFAGAVPARAAKGGPVPLQDNACDFRESPLARFPLALRDGWGSTRSDDVHVEGCRRERYGLQAAVARARTAVVWALLFGWTTFTACAASKQPQPAILPPSPEPMATNLAPPPVSHASKVREPTSTPKQLPADATPTSTSVFGEHDQEQRHRIGTLPIDQVKLQRGGRSVAFRIRFEDGSQALYKPEQTFAAYWYSELASYYLDRVLGLGRVPAAIGRTVPWSKLEAAARKSPHANEVVVRADGTVRGAMMYWLTEELVPLSPPPGWEAWLRVEPLMRPSPFQRQADYRRALQRFKAKPNAPEDPVQVPPPARATHPAELSDLIVFDYLIQNHDRWGGGFTNVRTLGPAGPLIAIDNANGFPPAHAADNTQTEAKLAAVQRFRARTLQMLEDLKLDELTSALASDPLAPLLSEEQLDELWQRRARALSHIRKHQRNFGKKALPW